MADTKTNWKVETRTPASTIAGLTALGLIVLAFLVPTFAGRAMIQDLFFILTLLILAQFWNLLAGYAGLVSIGQQAFVGMGAYAMFGGVVLWGMDPIPAILLGGVAAMILAVPTAYFAFRLQGAYFAIGTWVIAEVVRLCVAQWKALGGGTGTSMPREAAREMMGLELIKTLFDVKTSAARDILAYWIALILAVLTIGGIYWLLRTKRGLALAAVRDNPEAARSVGVDAAAMKWVVFLISALGTGLAGALIYIQKGRISPDAAFSVTDWTAYVIFVVVIGGIGTIEGPIIGVLVFFLLQSLFSDFGSWYLLALGALGIVIMLFAPGGLWGLFTDRTGIQLFPIRRRLSGGPMVPPAGDPQPNQPSSPNPAASAPARAAEPVISQGRHDNMADITTDVLIIGTGPAGSATAALLSTYGIENMAVNRYRWLANTPRAHITNQRTMEVLRDLGQDVEDEGYLYCTPNDLMGNNVFCTSLAGEEVGRLHTWGTAPMSAAEHKMSSPTRMNDLPQTFMEPLLFKTACSRGTQARMSTEYISHEQDAEGVTATLLDRLTGNELTVRAKYLIGADGGNSLVAEHAQIPIEGQMGVAGSINLLFKADLSKYVAHRPSVLYWVLQPGSDVGGIGAGVVRMVRPWNEWLAIWGYDINEPRPELTDDEAIAIIRNLIGDQEIEIEMQGVSYWTVNDAWATHMQNGRVFCMGDATHRHPPTNGLGSNTSIQDAFNLAWKLAAVLKGQAGEQLLETYSQERAPVAAQIVRRANQSMGDYGPIFGALGMAPGMGPEEFAKNLDDLAANTDDAEASRKALRDAIAFKKYEFDAHGVEMNQRYKSDAIVTDGQLEPAFAMDEELYYQPTTWPGARVPHVWLYDANGVKHSTLDLCGQGKFSVLTGIGGDGWIEAAKTVGAELGIEISTCKIGPRCDVNDYVGDWARARETEDSGIVLVRPDQHVAWRHETIADDPTAELRRVLTSILAR